MEEMPPSGAVDWLLLGPLQAVGMAAVAACCARGAFALAGWAGASGGSLALAAAPIGAVALGWISKRAAAARWWGRFGALWLAAPAAVGLAAAAVRGQTGVAAIWGVGIMVCCMWPWARWLMVRQGLRERRRAEALAKRSSAP